ncbi:hypothetical protein [Corynebacterium heidelbergense]|uniref:J domain-containing protein n=2 Tax=Corynebacterium heidelbergense TaxID=2055947 RepID=A0A364VDJ1_9CORY|nr:hypothetical protein [Corynebacterium heidelbergense]RAV34715.1 hypothetical protein CWC39_01810 [Corynebacterium heidelbergense]WCZ37349.1 hypothetical protein CHEID_09095 [Corynebacterium heidelbergense]
MPATTGHSGHFREDPEYIRRRRAIIRRYHPDRGGSDEALVRALRELDEQWSRKSYLRHQVEQLRPPFISREVALQAVNTAEDIAAGMQQRAAGLNRRAGDVRQQARSAWVQRDKLRDLSPGDVGRAAVRVSSRASGIAAERLRRRARRKKNG